MVSDLICLVGLHGSGKTTIGRALALLTNHVHVSVGDLGRIARRGLAPSDVPTRLLSCFSRHKPGTALSEQSSVLLVDYLRKLSATSTVSVDGFPSHPSHISLLPSNAQVWHVEVSDNLARESRLAKRGELTKRQWVDGLKSERDILLGDTLTEAGKCNVKIVNILNDGEASDVVDRCRSLLEIPQTI